MSEPNAFNTQDVRPWNQPQLINDKVIPSSNLPSYPTGITSLDIDKSKNLRIKAFADEVKPDSVKVHLDSWADTVLYSAGSTWLKVFPNDRDIQSGTFNTTDDHPWDKPQVETNKRIVFATPYHAPPKVIVWLNELDVANKANCRVRLVVADVDANGFKLSLNTWGDTTLYSAGATWIAYPANRPNIASGVFRIEDVRPWNQPRPTNEGSAKFDKVFPAAPRVIAALNQVDIGNAANLRIRVTLKDINKEGLKWNLDAWADTVLYSANAAYIAILDY